MLHLFGEHFRICIPQHTHSHILFSIHTRAARTDALMLHAICTGMARAHRIIAYQHPAELRVIISHKPSAPDSAGTDCGYNEWGKSMPHADSP